MSADAWITLAIVAAMLVGLASDRLPHSGVVFAATFTLLITDVIDADAAFSGFSNTAPITVAALYVLARAVQKTSLLATFTTRLLGAKPTRTSLARLAVPTAGASAFLNNTPLVAMLIPDVLAWCRSRGVSPSRYLLPLSYATILGGTVTVLGTSTNLVVSGLLDQAGSPLGVFEIFPVAILSAVAGIAVVIFICPRLVPERLSAPEQVEQEAREFVVDMVVDADGPLVGRTVAEAGLRDLEGVFLFRIEREGAVISPVAPDRRISGGDVLTFVGRVDEIVDLQNRRGLHSTADKHLLAIDSPEQRFFEAVVSRRSRLVGRSLRDAEFRGTYQAAVVAIHRDGQRIDAKLGEVELRHGDTLLLLAGPDFRTSWRDHRDFLLIAPLSVEVMRATRKAPIVGLAAVAMVALAALDVLPILEGAIAAAGIMVVTRVLTFREAQESIDFDVILLIGAAFGLGEAMTRTGLADEIADSLVSTFDHFGAYGVIFGVLLATSILTEIITNNAAVVVVFPIAIASATAAGIDPRLMAIAIGIAASSSFLTPIGYQTNTMVYGPGGYRFSDYLRVGLPVNLTVLVVLTAVVGSR